MNISASCDIRSALLFGIPLGDIANRLLGILVNECHSSPPFERLLTRWRPPDIATYHLFNRYPGNAEPESVSPGYILATTERAAQLTFRVPPGPDPVECSESISQIDPLGRSQELIDQLRQP